MKRLALVMMLAVVMLVSCRHTVYTAPSLPEYSPVVPSRPVLRAVDGEVPVEAVSNLIDMMGYARSLEIICKGWETFYEDLRELYQSDSI